MSTLRILLTVAVADKRNLTSVDVRQAFLLAKLDRPQYMRMPPGLPRYDNSGAPLCLRLLKSVYGLSQAGKAWSDLLVSFLSEYGFTRSTIDTCLFWLKIRRSPAQQTKRRAAACYMGRRHCNIRYKSPST